MNQTENNNRGREKKAMHLSVTILDKFMAIRDAANSKDYGKRVSLEDVAATILEFIDTKIVVKKLRDSSMRSQDHIEHIYKNYCKTNGKIEYSDFLLKAITKQIDVNIDIEKLTKAAANA